MGLRDHIAGTTSDTFAIGNGAAGDKYIQAENAAGTLPFIRYNDTTKKWELSNDGIAIVAFLTQPVKAGIVMAGSFAGTPIKKATVTFATPFVDADYAVVLQPVTQVNGAQYCPNIESQLAGSFVISMGTNAIGNLIQVNWTAVKSGES